MYGELNYSKKLYFCPIKIKQIDIVYRLESIPDQLVLDEDFKLDHASFIPGVVEDPLVVDPALDMDQLAQESPHLAGVKLEGHQGRMIVLGISPVREI